MTLSAAINYCVETLLEVFLTLVAIFYGQSIYEMVFCVYFVKLLLKILDLLNLFQEKA